MTDTMSALFDVAKEEVFADVASDPEIQRAFDTWIEREAAPGELAAHLEEKAQAWRAQNTLFVSRVQHYFHKAIEHFTDMHSQRVTLARPNRVEFVFADSPVVVTTGPGGIAGTAAKPVALLQAEGVWCPLSPSVGISLCSEPRDDVVLGPSGGQQLNLLSWRYASRFVGARPGVDLDRALAKPAGTFSITP